MKLNVKAFGLAGGILWGLGLFLMTIIVMLIGQGYGITFLGIISNVYPGYKVTAGGAFLGLVYGFIDGFIGCAVFAWLYNKLVRK